MKKVYILGGEGNGLVIAASILRNNECVQVAFLNDVDAIGTQIGKFRKIPVEGRTEEIRNRLNESDAYVISAYGGFTDPQKTLDRLLSLNVEERKWIRFIDKTVVIPADFCHIGFDVFIGPLAQLSPNVVVSNHCSVFGNAFIGHDSIVGEFCHLATNSVIGSNVTIGKGVHIGSNCVIREKIHIGDYSVIGAGSVVVKDIEENSIVAGNPARLLKKRE